MITQIEVVREGSPIIYWVEHHNYRDQILNVGTRILLAEEGATPLTIRRTFVSISDGSPLPPGARVGTLLEILN